jgi:MFS superfamily sulfate permease-like transporter
MSKLPDTVVSTPRKRLVRRFHAHRTTVESDHRPATDQARTRTLRVRGELFFASCDDLTHEFDYSSDPDDVLIGLSDNDIRETSSAVAPRRHLWQIPIAGKTLQRRQQHGGPLRAQHVAVARHARCHVGVTTNAGTDGITLRRAESICAGRPTSRAVVT